MKIAAYKYPNGLGPNSQFLSKGLLSLSRIAILAVLFLTSLTSQLSGQNYGVRQFSLSDGLPDGYIYSMVQDHDGYLWLTTGSGILRFDGLEFRSLPLPDGFPDPKVDASFVDSKGSIWFGHFDGGITQWANNSLNNVYQDESFSTSIVGISEDSDGYIWVASQRSGLLRIDSNGVAMLFNEELKGKTLFSMEFAAPNLIFLGNDEGVLEVHLEDGNPLGFSPVNNLPPAEVVTMSSSTQRNGVWVGLKDFGLHWFSIEGGGAQSARQVYPTQNASPLNRIETLLEAPDGRLWVGTPDQSLRVFAFDVALDSLIPAHETDSVSPLSRQLIRCMLRDKFGQMWVGMYGNGLFCLSQRTMSEVNLLNAPDAKITAFWQAPSGATWLGTDQGLYQISREGNHGFEEGVSLAENLSLEANRFYGTAEGLPDNHITAITGDDKGNVWIGTAENGLALLANGQDNAQVIQYSQTAYNRKITGLQMLEDGRLWIATLDGASLFNPQTGFSDYFGTKNGLSHNHVYDLIRDSKGRTLFATRTSLVSIFENQEFENLRVSDTGEVAIVNCLLEGPHGTMWFGAEGGGLYSYDGTDFRKYTQRNGLLSDYIDQLTIDPLGHIWAAHREGISRFIPETDSIRVYPFSSFTSFEKQEILHMHTDLDGNIWLGGEKSLVYLPWVSERNTTAAPKVSISSTTMQGEDKDLVEGPYFPYSNSYKLTVEFIGLSFIDQDRVRYQYRLLGRDKEWSEPTQTTTASFPGLSDGEYTFEVRAVNAFGKRNEEPSQFAFTIAPPFWKTWTFQILVLLALGALIYAYGRYRVFKLNKEKEDLEEKIKDRTRELEEEKLKLEEANLELEKLSLVASETDNAVLIFDNSGKLEWVNDGFSRLTGYSQGEVEELKQQHSLDMTPGSETRRLLDEIIRNNSSVQYESQLPHKNGNSIWVISTLTPILNEKGELRKIVIIDLDISDRKKAEEKVKQVNEKLEQLVEVRTKALAEANDQLQVENQEHIKTANQLTVINRELDQFVYRASHDLKGPLASLMGLFNIARGELEDNPVALRYLDLMERSGSRLDNILVDLIEVTQVKQGKTEFEPIIPQELVAEVFELLQDKPGYEKMVFEKDIPEGLVLVSDKKLIRSIFQNFIENSAKYRDPQKENPKSSVFVRLEGDFFMIRVSDNGIGIEDHLKDKVFQMFFRGTHQAGGSGLGLYIVKQAIEKLGGSLEMETEFGKGTTMTARIPNENLQSLDSEEA